MENKVFESFSDFYKTKIEELQKIEESHIAMGATVKLPNGETGTVQSWDDASGTYIVMNSTTGATERVTGEEITVLESKKIDEKDISSDEEFKGWATSVLKKAHGDDYDESIANKMVKDLIKKFGDDYGAMIGAVSGSIGEEEKEKEKEDEDKKVNEDDITQGAKVKLSDGRLGTVEAWEDRTGMYTVSIEGEAKTVEVDGKDLEVLHTMDGIGKRKEE